jgi:hypothetical protein
MSTDKKMVDDSLKGFAPEVLDWFQQAQRQLGASFSDLANMPKKFTRETGMDEPDLDFTGIPYEPKK